MRADDDDDAATEDVDEKKAAEAFAAGAHDGTVMKSENLEEALAAAGLSQNESDVAAAFGELGGKEEITFPDFAHWPLGISSGKRRKPVCVLKRLVAKKPKIDLAAAIQRRAAGEASRRGGGRGATGPWRVCATTGRARNACGALPRARMPAAGLRQAADDGAGNCSPEPRARRRTRRRGKRR